MRLPSPVAGALRCVLVGSLLLVGAPALLVGAAAPALAAHEVGCPDYGPTPSEYVSDGETIAASLVNAADLGSFIAEGVEAPSAVQILFKVLDNAAKAAATILHAVNATADACREGNHWLYEDEQVRLGIETSLTGTGTTDSAYQLPAADESAADSGSAYYGFVDTPTIGTAEVVQADIDGMKAAGQCTCSAAQSYLDTANNQVAAGNYKTAYKYFRQAYVAAYSGS